MEHVIQKNNLFSAVVLAIPISVVFSNGVWANGSIYGDGYRAHPHTMWMESWASGHFMGPLVVLIFVVCVAALVVLFTRRSYFNHSNVAEKSSSEKRAVDILKERLARGEIDMEEYEERRRVLDH